jgi:PAS domain S-box-containing protein
MSTAEMSTLIHEMLTHQVKLEMQNEQLRQSRAETEASRRAYQDLWDLSPVGYMIVDSGGRVTAVNRAAQRLFGRPETDLLNKPFSMLVMFEEDQVPVQRMFEEALETGIVEKQEIRISEQKGPIHICLLEIRSLGGESGREQIQAVLTDITKLKQAEDDLINNEQEKIAILDSLMEHVVYHDREMKILWANRAACDSVLRKREDLLGRYCYEVWSDLNDPCEDCPVIKADETGQPQTVEKMTPDGRWWYIQVHPVRDSSGGFTGATEITLDITKRKRAEEAVSKAKEELEIKIAERTAELNEANCKLRQEIEVRKKAEKELQDNEILLSSSFDALQDLVIVIDKDFRVRISNWKDHHYISEKDRQGNPFCYEAFMNRKKPCNLCPAREVFATGEIRQLEGTNPIDGKIRDIRVLPMFDDKGNVVAVIEHIRNITDRKKMEQALRESRQRYQSIFENAPIGFYRTTADGRILDANPASMEILGYSSFKELAAVNLETNDFHPEYQRRLFRERIERDGEIKGLESYWKKPDNTLVYIRENARVIRDADGRAVCYEGTIEDISDQKRAEEHVHMLSRQLMQAQESERQMLSRELHDTVAQDLSVAKMECDLIYGELSKDRASEAQRVREISGLLQKTIHGVRSMSYELRPPGLEDLGLVETVYQFCEDFTQMWGVPVDFQSAGLKNVKLDHDIQINLYRLVQEGLTNIRKHAGASRATVKLVSAFPNIIIRIEDNGRGFDVQQRASANHHEKRMGLRSMQERVKLMNGEMKLQSKPGQGTKVAIKVPLEER